MITDKDEKVGSSKTPTLGLFPPLSLASASLLYSLAITTLFMKPALIFKEL